MKTAGTLLFLVVLPATFIALSPACHGVLLYDRTAILQGEWWRLWTGHWVHFSGSHLGWNLAVLVCAGAWLEHLRPGRLISYIMIGAPLISLGLLAGEPAMQTYGGLSGLATGIVTWLALTQLARADAARAWWAGALVLISAKTAFDASHLPALFAQFDSPDIRSSALAHAAGAGTALVFFLSRPIRFCLPLSRAVRSASPPLVVSR